jgi:SAM-dependent methyltransferase
MGTGTWLEEMSATCRVLGLDDHDESLAIAGPRLKAAGGAVLKTSLERVALPDSIASAVTAMDVLEHLKDDAGALRELVRLARPGGVIVLTVPALPFLWSDWDVALHHVRRYRRSDLATIIAPLEVDVIRLAYFNASAVLPIWLIRRWRKHRPATSQSTWAEHRLPGPLLNRLLHASMVIPSRWGWFRPPLGVSLLAVLRKRDDAR